MWVPINSGNGSGSCSENCGFRIAQVARCHSDHGILHSENQFLNSESCSENTPELCDSSENGLFTPRAFFLKLGGPQASEVSLWKNGLDSLSKQVGVLKGATKSRDFCDSDREMLLRRPEPCEP